MYILRYVLTLLISTVLMVPTVFADNASGMTVDTSSDKSCSTIADACLAAGFVKTESTSKGIWHDCMRPVILGKTVSGIKVDSSVVKSCRMHKIEELKTELKEMQKAG